MLKYIDLASIQNQTEEKRDAFNTASPFKHVSFQGLIQDAKLAELEDAFPEHDWSAWTSNDHEHQRFKMSCSDISKMPHALATVIHELNSGPFLRWLEDITGIEQLLPDPHLNGGGLHVTKPGGYLTPHTDFHTISGLSLYRRLNLLLYLNRDWKPDNQGYLELWEKDGSAPEKEVKPELGQCVIFQTDDVSVHGFSKPLVDRSRHSIAIYYYTVSDAEEYSGSGVTFWKPHSEQATGLGDRFRYGTERAMMTLSRGLASASWRVASAAQKMWK